jgi:hypothetical protein
MLDPATPAQTVPESVTVECYPVPQQEPSHQEMSEAAALVLHLSQFECAQAELPLIEPLPVEPLLVEPLLVACPLVELRLVELRLVELPLVEWLPVEPPLVEPLLVEQTAQTHQYPELPVVGSKHW